MAKKQCKICGKDGYLYYPYCYKHLPNKDKFDEINYEKEPWELEEDELDFLESFGTCILCGEETNNSSFLFCKDCYNQYKNKSIIIQIDNCKDITILGENKHNNTIDTGLIYTCKDGHKVRSKSEKIIDDYLFDHKIFHIYEKPYPISKNKNEDLHPDFYLPEEDIYIEHWGYENKSNYEETKQYKLSCYKKNKTTVIGTNEEDTKDIETALTRKLNYYKRNTINFCD